MRTAPWEPIELGGRRHLVWEPECSKLPVPIQIRLKREGTEVQLSSQELGRAEPLEVARSLVPAPTEPPPLTQSRSGTRRLQWLLLGS
jgi:hypothetical protein